jgi:5-formyltetrahydrofolate cyclo-ligase
MNNKQLRQQIRHLRSSFTPEFQKEASIAVCEKVLHLTRYRMSHHVAFYLAHQGELDPAPILQHAHENGKKCYLPVLHPSKINTLCFISYTPGDPLHLNVYDIPEPLFDEKKIYPTWQLDIVFTPLVAFDAQLNRLGMGGGYYDRTFAFLNQTKNQEKPFLLGLAYEMQKVEHLCNAAHDVKLQTVITNKKAY